MGAVILSSGTLRGSELASTLSLLIGRSFDSSIYVGTRGGSF